MVLEEVETTEAGCAGSSSIASGAWVGAVGADSTTRSDGSIDATCAVVGGRARCAVSWAVHADLLVGVEELSGLTSPLADGSGSDKALSTSAAVGWGHRASVA